MSVHINLLPYRDERRRMRQRQFGTQIGLVAALALAIVLLVHMLVSGNIGAQQERNQFLKQELARLDKDIGEIGRLKQEVAALLARKQVIERLQSDRAQAVHLLDQLVRQVPEGVYLRQVKQVGLGINLQGYSQANARVSTLMRNLAESAYLENPVLVEIKSATVNNRRVSEFSMNVSLREQLPSQAKPVTTPAVSAPVSTPGGAAMNEWLETVRNLQRDPSRWPLTPRVILMLSVFVLVLIGGYLGDIQDQLDTLDSGALEEDKLKGQYLQKKQQAVNLAQHRQQLEDIDRSFGALLKQLPDRAQMDALLVDINHAGVGRGLQFELFKPAAQETLREFYAELPIQIRITGAYHEMGKFASDIGGLSRIVTLNDIEIRADAKGGMVMDAVAKTFRYLDDKELTEQRKAAKKK